MEDREEDREKALCHFREGPAHLLLFLIESNAGKTPLGTRAEALVCSVTLQANAQTLQSTGDHYSSISSVNFPERLIKGPIKMLTRKLGLIMESYLHLKNL